MRNDALERSTIVETKNAKFFEHIYPISKKVLNIPMIDNVSEDLDKNLRMSKRSRNDFSFGNDFYAYLVNNDPISNLEVIFLLMHHFGKKPLNLNLILL